MENHARKYGYENVGKVSATRLTDLLEGFIVDHVTARLKHGGHTNVATGLIYKYWPGFNANTRKKIFDDTMVDIVTSLENKLKAYLPLYAWNVWSSQRIGFDLLLTIGQDFRILEWERLTGYTGTETDDELRLLIAESRPNKIEGENEFASPEPGLPDA